MRVAPARSRLAVAGAGLSECRSRLWGAERVAGDGGASKARERRLGEIPAEALAD
jgi:hypothetical protein